MTSLTVPRALSSLFMASVWLAYAPATAAELETTLPLRQIFVGEDAALNIQSTENTTGPLRALEESELTFLDLGTDILGGYGRAFNIGVTSKTVGKFPIPPFEVPLVSGIAQSSAQEIEAFGTDDIEWQTLKSGDETFRIGAVLLYPRGPIYAGQSIPLTGKILLPVELPVSSTGYAELEKGNIGAWRMESPTPPNYDRRVSPRPPNALRLREVRIEGKRYQVVNYVTFAAPLAPGEVTVGPAEIKGLQVLLSSEQSRGGFFSRMQRSYNLDYTIPAAKFTAKSLPAGAPESYQGAIGDFDLIASLDISKEPKAGEPIEVQLEVSGRGNLDILKAPLLQASESNWKIYPASRNEQTGDRRSNQGAVAFSQILRPLAPTKNIPPFEFSFFNPESARYETLTSDPIPLNLVVNTSTSTNSPPEAGLVPVAEMSDILSIIPPQAFQNPSDRRLGPLWQIIPALIAAFFLLLIARRHLPQLLAKDPDKEDLQRQLAEVENATEDGTFIRKAAAFAEQKGLPHDDFVVALLAERDAQCFQPGKDHVELDPERRREILQTLRAQATRLLILVAFVGAAFSFEARASLEDANQAWEEADYETALTNFQALAETQETPDLLYNIGNCLYRLEKPAEAALYYHRALRLDPGHPEAKQNLAFINRKLGAMRDPSPPPPTWTRRLPLSTVHFAIKLSIWLLVLGLLGRFSLTTNRGRAAATGTVIGGAALLVLAILTFVFYPEVSSSQPAPGALVTSATPVEVRTEPTTAGSIILNASPTTACTVVARREPWAYIQLPDGTRGWLRSEALSEI